MLIFFLLLNFKNPTMNIKIILNILPVKMPDNASNNVLNKVFPDP